MITAFHLIASDNIDIRLDLLSFADKGGLTDMSLEERKKFMYAKTRGVKWIADNKEYTIYEEGVKLSGIVTPDREKVVVVYPAEHAVYSSPNNAVIYNSDGSIYRPLTCPTLISELGKQRKKFLNSSHPYNLFFSGAIWKRSTDGEIVMAMNIDFNLEYYETRELNYITGEFGACLDSSRT